MIAVFFLLEPIELYAHARRGNRTEAEQTISTTDIHHLMWRLER